MVSVANVQQEQAWNGYEGTHWARHQEQYDHVNSGFNEALLTAAGIGRYTRILDVGCGNGQTTRLAARRAADGHATGLDLSAPMLEQARATADREGVENTTFLRGDAQVYPLPAQSFDAVISRFGVMFFADPTAAFANIAQSLSPEGRLAFVSMGPATDDGLLGVFNRVAVHLPGLGPAGPQEAGPLSLSDPGRVQELLGAAGFQEIAVTRVTAHQYWGPDVATATEFLWGWGPVRHHWSDSDEATAARAHASMSAALEDYATAEGVYLPSHSWLVTARRAQKP